jgi:hypothetical protein
MSEKAVEENVISPEISQGPPEHSDNIGRRKSFNDVIYSAQRATEKEHKMSLWQGIKLYPKAVGWSILISTCICMEGYDVCLLSNFCKSAARDIFRSGTRVLTGPAQMPFLSSGRSTASNFPMAATRSQHLGKPV